MSWARMNFAERPRYLIGEAIMRYLEDRNDRPERAAALEAIRGVLLQRLTDEEIMDVTTGTGWDIAGWFEHEDDDGPRPLDVPSPDGCPDAEIPF